MGKKAENVIHILLPALAGPRRARNYPLKVLHILEAKSTGIRLPRPHSPSLHPADKQPGTRSKRARRTDLLVHTNQREGIPKATVNLLEPTHPRISAEAPGLGQ